MAKIMLVEDDNNLREIYGARLLAEGHEIVTAKDGEEALAIAVKEKPELIISDVMMPKISGFDMLDILRNAPETKFTKVIIMTALSQTEDKARADSLGADRYLVKSQVTLEDVAKTVRDVLEGKPKEFSPAPVAAIDPTSTTKANPAPEPVALFTAPSVDSAPEINPVAKPATVVDPIVASTADPVASTPITVTSPDPVATDDTVVETDVAPEPTIKVELPSMSTPATETVPEPLQAPETTPAPEEATTPIGPNLSEALQQEGSTPAQSQEITTPIETPTVMNGIENPVVTPTTTEIAAETKPSEEISEITDPTAETVKKKGVIEPINNLTGPNLNDLLDAEEKKAPIENPPANSVIEPAGTAPTVPDAPKSAQANEHDVISL